MYFIIFQITNYIQNLDFAATDPELETRSNRLNSFTFKVKNNSQRKITFRPKLIVEPEQYRKYIKLHQCLCSSKHTLDAQEEREMKMLFSINKDFDDLEQYGYEIQNEYNNPVIKLRYRID